ncbi:hypothetical protein D3C85_1241080 [compost metagenome]
MLRLLLKFINTEVLVRIQDTETAGFFERDVNDGNCTIRVLFLMVFKHGIVIHFINVVPGKNENMLGIILFNKLHVSVYGISCTTIPTAAILSFMRRKHEDTPIFALHIPVTAYTNI